MIDRVVVITGETYLGGGGGGGGAVTLGWLRLLVNLLYKPRYTRLI